MDAPIRKLNRLRPARSGTNRRSETERECAAIRLERWIQVIRNHLGMDVAFVSEFGQGRRLFRWVDSCLTDCPVVQGQSDPLESTFCQRVVDGRFPELMPCVPDLPEANALSRRLQLTVGAHLSVPITLKNGDVFGTFCCYSLQPNHGLGERDLALMRAVAELVSHSIDDEREAKRHAIEARARIEHMLRSADGLRIVYQPIYNLIEERIVGYEALARFQHGPARGPDHWFAEAVACGLGPDLELKAIEIALGSLKRFPDRARVSINVSPETMLDHRLRSLLKPLPVQRIVLELTEHVATTCYAQIADALTPLRAQGMQLAVDDAGAGHSSFLHILSLSPDVIKLDIGLTRDIDRDPNRRFLATALIGFAASAGVKIVAEGVERQEELDTLKALGVQKAQGYYLGKPMTLDDALALA
nr:EAL domain-containing protein [Pseudomarimonas arenosa]